MSDHSTYLLDIPPDSVYLVPVEESDNVVYYIGIGIGSSAVVSIDDYLNGIDEISIDHSLSRESVKDIIYKKVDELFIIKIDKITYQTSIDLLLPCSSNIYHEKQVLARCGLHSVNNLLQKAAYTNDDLMSIAIEVEILELGKYDDYKNMNDLLSKYSPNDKSSPHYRQTGWYSIEVLNMATRLYWQGLGLGLGLGFKFKDS